MKVKDVMTKSVAYVDPATSVQQAAQLMEKHNVGSIPVCDKGSVVGIITDRDIVLRNIAQGTDPKSTEVSKIMTAGVITATPDMEMNEVTRMMEQQQVRRIPVVQDNKLVGIVALGDMAVDKRFDTEASQALSEISKPIK